MIGAEDYQEAHQIIAQIIADLRISDPRNMDRLQTKELKEAVRFAYPWGVMSGPRWHRYQEAFAEFVNGPPQEAEPEPVTVAPARVPEHRGKKHRVPEEQMSFF